MLKKNKEGFYFQTEKGKYSLLEGISIGGEKTYSSDILFIVDDLDINRPAYFVGFVYGAFQLDENNEYFEDFVDHIKSIIEDYERRNDHE